MSVFRFNGEELVLNPDATILDTIVPIYEFIGIDKLNTLDLVTQDGVLLWRQGFNLKLGEGIVITTQPYEHCFKAMKIFLSKYLAKHERRDIFDRINGTTFNISADWDTMRSIFWDKNITFNEFKKYIYDVFAHGYQVDLKGLRSAIRDIIPCDKLHEFWTSAIDGVLVSPHEESFNTLLYISRIGKYKAVNAQLIDSWMEVPFELIPEIFIVDYFNTVVTVTPDEGWAIPPRTEERPLDRKQAIKYARNFKSNGVYKLQEDPFDSFVFNAVYCLDNVSLFVKYVNVYPQYLEYWLKRAIKTNRKRIPMYAAQYIDVRVAFPLLTNGGYKETKLLKVLVERLPKSELIKALDCCCSKAVEVLQEEISKR